MNGMINLKRRPYSLNLIEIKNQEYSLIHWHKKVFSDQISRSASLRPIMEPHETKMFTVQQKDIIAQIKRQLYQIAVHLTEELLFEI